uniref:Uncharacterized protein n=1 Tax=Tetranychus urticae TaxID=32264 RepID=T1JXH5_TETUR
MMKPIYGQKATDLDICRSHH